MSNHLPFLRFIRIDGKLVLRVTCNGEIENDYPVSIREAALLVAEGALFVRDRLPEIEQEKK